MSKAQKKAPFGMPAAPSAPVPDFLEGTLQIVLNSVDNSLVFSKTDHIHVKAALTNKSATETIYFLPWKSVFGTHETDFDFDQHRDGNNLLSRRISRVPFHADELVAIGPGEVKEALRRVSQTDVAGEYRLEANPLKIYTAKDLATETQSWKFNPSVLTFKVQN
jgi:hypothetical protein